MSFNLGDLANLPPGTNVFDYLDSYIAEQVYGVWTTSFWIQAYLAAGLLALISLIILGSLIAKYKQGQLRWFVIDGAATRPELRSWVPILWTIYSIFLITHTFWMHGELQRNNLSPALGRFWWFEQITLTFSYNVISISVLSTAPPVRRFLIRMNGKGTSYTKMPPSSMLLLGFLVLMCLGMLAGLSPAALKSGNSFAQAQSAYQGSLAVIDQARQTSNLTLLAGLLPYVTLLEQASDLNLHAQQIGGSIFVGYCVLEMLASVIPGVALNMYIGDKIKRLERQAADDMSSAMMTQESQVGTPESERRTSMALPTIKPDAPFTDLLPVETQIVPPNFAKILGAKSSAPSERARRLAAALRQERNFILAYLALLLLLSALAVYEAAGGQTQLSAQQRLMVAYCWPIWSFVIPGALCAGLLVYDVMHKTTTDQLIDTELDMQAKNVFRPKLTGIALQQTVELNVEGLHLEKDRKLAKDDDSIKGDY